MNSNESYPLHDRRPLTQKEVDYLFEISKSFQELCFVSKELHSCSNMIGNPYITDAAKEDIIKKVRQLRQAMHIFQGGTDENAPYPPDSEQQA